jgi:predicted ATPase/transcriptional regulator with XRE-family HTH domain
VSAERLPPFPALLRELRRAAGLTQEELAQGARVGVRTLRDLETGRAIRPQRSTVDLLANALGLQGADRDGFVAAARGRQVPRQRSAPTAVSLTRPSVDLVGRDSAVRGIAALLDIARLVTLVGLAGVGKSALARTVGHLVADRHPGGVGGIGVTEASTVAEVLASVAATFAVPRVDGLAARLSTDPALLVIDAADRQPAAVLAALATLRQEAPDLRVLVTSRQPLGRPDEHEWPVPPLDVPAPAASPSEVFAAPATALFLERLRKVRASPVDESEAPTLGELVRRLGGVPLALELAAARGRVLDLDEMLLRIADTSADTDPAGQSLRAAVTASWQVLTPAEQACLSRLAIFQWRWSMSMAERLLEGASTAGDVVVLVDRLVALGLVTVRADDQELRFRLPEPVRAVAVEQAGVGMRAARDRHAELMATIAARSVADLDGPERAAATTRLDHLAADLHAARAHLERIGASEPAAALGADLDSWRRLRGLPPGEEDGG